MAAETRARQRLVLFQPLAVLLISLAVAAFFGVYLLRGSLLGSKSFGFPPAFFYVVPIVVPFVAFLFDRAERIRETSAVRLFVDIFVIGFSMARVFTDAFPVSGHTLFLTYAMLSSRSPVVVVTASLVMLQTVYLKYFVWHDLITSTSGIVIGGLAAYLVSRMLRRHRKDHKDA